MGVPDEGKTNICLHQYTSMLFVYFDVGSKELVFEVFVSSICCIFGSLRAVSCCTGLPEYSDVFLSSFKIDPKHDAANHGKHQYFQGHLPKQPQSLNQRKHQDEP